MLYHPDPDEFIANSKEYGALGKAMVSLSNLEFAHDDFVFEMHKKNQDLTLKLSKKFPRHFKEKTDFLINAVANSNRLLQLPMFATGQLNLLWLQYQLDELYEIRAIIAHGSIFFSETTPDRITWKFERIVQSEKNAWRPEAVEISNGYLASVYYSASCIKRYIVNLTRCLKGDSCWESMYQADKQIRRNRLAFSELVATGVAVKSDRWINAFPPLGPVE